MTIAPQVNDRRTHPGPLWPLMLPTAEQGIDEMCAVSAQGVRVRFADGREYLAGTSGLWNANLGFGNLAIAEAAAAARYRAYAQAAEQAGRPRLAAAWLDLAAEKDRLAIVQLEAAGKPWSPTEEDAFKAPIREQYEAQGNPYYSTARLWDDGIIDPADTRTVLGLALSVCANAPLDPVSYGVFRM